jgi:hypothetical protein
MFAADSPPASSACLVLRNDPETLPWGDSSRKPRYWTSDASSRSARTATSTARGPAPWPICGLSLALLVAGLLLPADTPAGVLGLAPIALLATANAVVGGLLAARRPEHPIGWLLSASGLLMSIAHFAGQYAHYTLVTRPGSLPWGQATLWLAGWPSDAGFVLVVFLLLLFPTGRLLSPRWRPVPASPRRSSWSRWWGAPSPPARLTRRCSGSCPNPLGIEAFAEMVPVAQAVVTGLGLMAAVAAVASLLLRLRRARGVERLQLKWFCLAAALLPVVILVAIAFPSVGGVRVDGLIVGLPLVALPVAIGIAVLRYRLYDIDRLINRTLVYGLLTALLGGVNAALVLILGWLFGGIGSETPSWVVAGATLAVAALFQPARRRIQQAVDRRFNRRRYDAAKTVEAFTTCLRDQVDLDSLSGELLAVVDQTVRPTMASLWLRPATQVQSAVKDMQSHPRQIPQ